MSESGNTLFVAVLGNADALGALTMTNAVTDTFAGAGFGAGFAGATAVAVGTPAAPPYTDATTNGLVGGGSTTSSLTDHVSIDFPYGPTPVSASISVMSVTTYGVADVFSGSSLSGLASPFVHGVL